MGRDKSIADGSFMPLQAGVVLRRAGPRPPMELHSGSIITQNDWLMNFLMNCSANFQKTSVEICRKSAGFSDKNFSKIRGIMTFDPRISAVFVESATFSAGC